MSDLGFMHFVFFPQPGSWVVPTNGASLDRSTLMQDGGGLLHWSWSGKSSVYYQRSH